MEIQPGLELIDLGLLVKSRKTLIIGDLHIGYEEALNKQGILVPRFSFNQLLDRLQKIMKQADPKTVVINGDIKHEFGEISDQEWRDTLKIIDLITKSSKLILIRGNHDKILGPIAKKRDVDVKDYMMIEDIYICHGHKIPEDSDFKKAEIIIIGHEHPAITLEDGARQEKFKCFLLGKFRRKNLIVLPSMNLFVEGTDILKEKLLSPFLSQRLGDFRVFVVEDKVYDFGKVRNIS
ncbi:metallophosphoesterase [Candidatus Woesearchaeota archaeon]|nr:metallophosphoesterase [Candidatus Woesearchaeota archaeon]